LKTEFDAKNMDNLDAAMDRLNTAFQAASQEMYNAANQGGADAGQGNTGGANTGDEVTDVDFEEVDEKK